MLSDDRSWEDLASHSPRYLKGNRRVARRLTDNSLHIGVSALRDQDNRIQRWGIPINAIVLLAL
jgi:hypothetical protein